MMDEHTPLVEEDGVPSTQHDAGSSTSKMVFTGDNIVSNGYDELLHSLLTEDNTSFKNIHFTSRVGITRICLGGSILGGILGTHLVLFFTALSSGNRPLLQWCLYVFAMVVFHYMEFLTTAAFKPRDVSFNSYLLNHSKAYGIAAVASWVEFWLELWIAPSLKGHLLFIIVGTLLVAGFQYIRSSAMITAGRNFNHIVQNEAQSDGHELVTAGLYKYLRHPSYFGWFWWSISTQFLLSNPICVCAYAYASWKFFESRIYHEERHLYIDIFPNKYGQYCKTTKIGIPFIKGYVDTLQD